MAPAAVTDCDVLVVGAGLAGLAAGHRLQREGIDAVVVERDEIGGRARSELWEGCTIDLGGSFIPPTYLRLRGLIDDCGMGGQLAPVPNTLRTGVRRNGEWHHLDFRWPELEILRYGGLSWREKASLMRLVGHRLRRARSLRFFDMASVASVDSGQLEAVVGRGANRYFASAFTEVLCGWPPEQVSLAFGVLASRFPIRRVELLKDGLGSLTGELGRRLGARSRTLVTSVRNEQRSVLAEIAGGESILARAAILATRAPEALQLWPGAPQQVRAYLGTQAYSEGFGVFLRTEAAVRRFDERGRELFLDIVPRGEGTDALRAVAYLNSLAPSGGLVGLMASPLATASNPDDRDLAARLEAEFAPLYPGLDLEVDARRILRWSPYMPAFPAGRARELAAFRASLAPGPVQLAGDYLYGPMMEGAVHAGQEAAARVIDYLNADGY